MGTSNLHMPNEEPISYWLNYIPPPKGRAGVRVRVRARARERKTGF